MHLYTHLNDKWRYAAERFTHDEDLHGSGMLQHDHDIGLVLDFLKRTASRRTPSCGTRPTTGPSIPHGPMVRRRRSAAKQMTTYEGGVRVISLMR
jgi:arylsulfatase